MNKRKRVVVVGYGVAGAAIVHATAGDYDVTVIPGHFAESSTASNQKWKHSGLLHYNKGLAKQMWNGYKNMDRVLESPYIMNHKARFIALDHKTLQERKKTWTGWGVQSWGLDFEALACDDYEYAGLLGKTQAVGGFSTPDCVMDFSELVLNLRDAAKVHDVAFLEGARAEQLEIEAGRVVGVRYRTGDDEDNSIRCDLCIIAIGAWTTQFLAQHTYARPLPITLRKCIVLTYPGELVPCLTVCLDVREGPSPDAALAPFKGETIAAESLGVQAINQDDRVPEPERVTRLIEEYTTCFPALEAYEPRISVCLKAEGKSNHDAPNVDYQIYTRKDHDLEGVIVVLPGKASLMFEMAIEAATAIGSLGIGEPRKRT